MKNVYLWSELLWAKNCKFFFRETERKRTACTSARDKALRVGGTCMRATSIPVSEPPSGSSSSGAVAAECACRTGFSSVIEPIGSRLRGLKNKKNLKKLIVASNPIFLQTANDFLKESPVPLFPDQWSRSQRPTHSYPSAPVVARRGRWRRRQQIAARLLLWRPRRSWRLGAASGKSDSRRRSQSNLPRYPHQRRRLRHHPSCCCLMWGCESFQVRLKNMCTFGGERKMRENRRWTTRQRRKSESQ